VALIAAIPATLSFLMNVINRHKIDEVRLSINGRLDQLLAITRAQALRDGAEAERRRDKTGDG
jgi:hypothetical protein